MSSQAQQIADDPLDKSPFTEPLRKFPDSISEPISEKDRKQLREAIESAVRNSVAPAYAKFAKFVRDDYAPHGRLDPGVWALPDGEARYRFAVRHQTTTDFTAEQIHQLGLKSVAEIETQMLSIAKAQGFSVHAAVGLGQKLFGIRCRPRDSARRPRWPSGSSPRTTHCTPATTLLIWSAFLSASIGRAPGSRTTNSSPPMRAT